jgi:hypothetical protein
MCAAIGTSAPESVSVNCLAQDFSYKPYGRPVFFTVSVPDGGDIRRRHMCRDIISVNKSVLVGEFVRILKMHGENNIKLMYYVCVVLTLEYYVCAALTAYYVCVVLTIVYCVCAVLTLVYYVCVVLTLVYYVCVVLTLVYHVCVVLTLVYYVCVVLSVYCLFCADISVLCLCCAIISVLRSLSQK